MTAKSILKICLFLSGLALIISLLFYYLDNPETANLLVVIFFILFLTGMNSNESLREFS